MRVFISAIKLGRRLATVGLIGLALGTNAVGIHPAGRAALAAEADAGSVVVSVRDGLLSVEAENATLGDVLREIAKQADFELVIDGELVGRISWSFDDVPVADGVRDLLQNFSSILTYAPAGVGDRRALAEVRVLRTTGDLSDLTDEAEKSATIGLVAETGTGQTPRTSLSQNTDAGDREDHLRTIRGLTRQPKATDVEELAYLLSDDEDPTIRSMAAIGLGKVRADGAKSALMAALSDEDSLVRRRAVQALGRKWGNEAVEPLSTVLLNDPDPTIRREAALRLGKITSEGPVKLTRR